MAARTVTGVRRCDLITPILGVLHWLHASQRVVFKRALMVWKCKLKLKVNVDLYSALLVNTPLYGDQVRHAEGISQFYLHAPHSSVKGMNLCLCLCRSCTRLHVIAPAYLSDLCIHATDKSGQQNLCSAYSRTRQSLLVPCVRTAMGRPRGTVGRLHEEHQSCHRTPSYVH